MLQDVVCFLESCESQVRTTGFIVALPAGLRDLRISFRPQVVNLLADFDAESVGKERLSDWEQVLDTWIEQLELWVGRVNQAAEWMVVERRKRPNVIISAEAVRKLFALWRTLDYLRAKLRETPLTDGTESAASKLLGRLDLAAGRCDRAVHSLRNSRIAWPEIQGSVRDSGPWHEDMGKEDLFENDWHRDYEWDLWEAFIEKVFLLAAHRETQEPDDLLQLDLLRSRPQLFEVWLLSRVLEWYREWGCHIQLLSLQTRKLACFRTLIWRLSYANAKIPVARITSGSAQWYLYYQLRRAGSGRDNMPDLVLASGSQADAPMLWIADPKYSERRAYTRKHYVEVGRRYRRDFAPHAMWVCEYFTRRDLFQDFEYDVEPGVKVLTEVQPGGRGLELLKNGVRDLHRSVTDGYFLAVDCSDGFRPTLRSMEGSLMPAVRGAVALYAFAEKLYPVVVLRADPEKTWQTLLEATRGQHSRLEVLGAELRRVAGGCLGRKDLILITGLADDAWPDGAWEDLRKAFGRISVIKDGSALAGLSEYWAR